MFNLPREIEEIIIMYAHPTLPDELKYEIENFEFEEDPVILDFNEFIGFMEYMLTQQMNVNVSVEINDEIIEFNF
jgi:hypothetical protein